MKKTNVYKYKTVRKNIGKEKSKINSRKDITKIEKIYLCQKAIKEYYDKNESKISDDVLIKLYDKEYNPSVFSELTMSLLSGFLAMFCEKAINFQYPYTPELGISKLSYFICLSLVFIILLFSFFFATMYVYNKVAAISSYDNTINEYHKELLDQYIRNREANYEKRDKNEPKRNKKNRKHK